MKRIAGLAALLATAAFVTPGSRAQTASVPLRSVYDHPALQEKVSLSLKDADVNKAVEESATGAFAVAPDPSTLPGGAGGAPKP